MTSEEVRHREAIGALLARYAISGDRGRLADLAACFAPDGVLKWPGGGGQGPEAIAAGLKGIHVDVKTITFTRHNLTTMHIDVAPDMKTATGRVYFFEISNTGPDHAGVYVDEYVRQGDAWFIASREIRVDWRAPTSVYAETSMPAGAPQ
jgi:hypothetical protein